MKTAVSIPDDVFKSAEKLARRRGVSRSRLYSDALTRLIEEDKHNAITAKLDEFYSKHPSEVDPFVRAAAYKTLARAEW